MSSELDRGAAAALAEMNARGFRVRAGLDVGFASAEASRLFRETCGGVWMTVEASAQARSRTAAALDPKTVLQFGGGLELPFEANQFDVVLLSPAMFSMREEHVQALVREVHRVLSGGGSMVFAVEMASSDGAGYTQRGIYELLRDGFDVVGLKRPPWWKFGLGGRLTTVCACRKNWRNRGTHIVSASIPVSAAMLSPRGRQRRGEA